MWFSGLHWSSVSPHMASKSGFVVGMAAGGGVLSASELFVVSGFLTSVEQPLSVPMLAKKKLAVISVSRRFMMFLLSD